MVKKNSGEQNRLSEEHRSSSFFVELNKLVVAVQSVTTSFANPKKITL